MSQFEQCANIKFMCRLGKSASEMLLTLQQVYGDTALKKSTVYNWFSRCKNGQEKLEDDQRSGRPSTSRTAEIVEKVWQLIQCDRRMIIVELEQEVGISHGSIHVILSDDLEMRRVSAKFVPRHLITDQMECHMMVAGDLFEKSTQDPTFLTKIVTGDESWVFAFNPETKVHSAEWHTCLPDQRNHALSNPRKKLCSLHFLTSTVWCTMSSYRLDRLLMVISTCKFCRGCMMQFGGNSATSGRESGFCITRATHRLLCSNSSPRKTFLSSPNHHTLWISLRVTFGCSLLWKWASRGCVLQPWRTSNRMRRPNSGGFQKKPSTGASNNGRIDGASVCVHKGPTSKVIR